jgi:hypothetical protein
MTDPIIGKLRYCDICKEAYIGHGNNAQPVAEGRCCEKCNFRKVLPERLRRAGAPQLAQAFESGLLCPDEKT